jgi:pimeloyl-ACP methyl ester carboxylesterase
LETGMTTTKKILGAMAALTIAASTDAQSAASPTAAVTIVLVHGALIDGSTWRGVYDVLTGDGYRVCIVQQPLTGLDEDIAATKRVLDQQDGPVVLVGHSYGGSIITVAGSDPKASAEFMARSQMPVSGAAFSAKLTVAAWHDKPSYAIIATEDRELDPAIARRMASRAGSKVTVLKGSHLIHISHPLAVARVIETAARAAK